MIFTIDKNNMVHIMPSLKSTYEQSKSDQTLIDEPIQISLFELLDDILSIRWIEIPYNSFYNPKFNYNEGGPFADHKIFLEWLHENNCIDKDHINKITFELLKTQFIPFNIDKWYRFYDSILLLNSEGFYNELDVKEKALIFYQLFPSNNYFSPCRNNEIENLFPNYIFSSNLEMLFYDVFKEYFEKHHRSFDMLLINKLTSNLIGDIYSCIDDYEQDKDFIDSIILYEGYDGYHKRVKEQIDETLLEIIWGKDYIKNKNSLSLFYQMSETNMIKFESLVSLIASEKFNDLVLEFDENNNYTVEKQIGQDWYRTNTKLLGYNQVPLSYFLNDNLPNKFLCQKFVYNCYKEYKTEINNIFNTDDGIDIPLLLGLYASCLTEIKIIKCSICGHHFVRNQKNNKQYRCNRCISETDKVFKRKNKTLSSNITSNSDRIKKTLKDNLDNFSHSERKNIHDTYKKLITEYNACAKKAIDVCSTEVMRNLYYTLDHKSIYEGNPYYSKEIKEQINAEISLMPTTNTHLDISGYNFNDLFLTHLTHKKYVKLFEDLNQAYNEIIYIQNGKKITTKNRDSIKDAIAYAERTKSSIKGMFRTINEEFNKYNIDLKEFENTQKQVFKVIEDYCSNHKITEEYYNQACRGRV